jgi:hypothetical protein
MANTPVYGWETPDDTDYVYQGAAAARTTANAIDSTLSTNITTLNTTIAALPQGVKSYAIYTTGSVNVSTPTEVNIMASPAFTPIAGRLYEITYSIGQIVRNATANDLNVFLRLGSGGTLLDTGSQQVGETFLGTNVFSVFPYTKTICLTSTQLGTSSFSPFVSVSAGTGTVQVQMTSSAKACIIVKDIGPA